MDESGCTPDEISRHFYEYVQYYFLGLASTESLVHLADTLLYESLRKETPLSPALFTLLKCASDPPSVFNRRQMTAWHRKLRLLWSDLFRSL